MKKQTESGVILIITLWVLLILSVIALGFSIELHLEARLARYQVDSHTAYYLAKAGIERAMVELKNDLVLDHKSRTAIYDGLDDSWSWTDDTKDIFDHFKLGEGTYTVNVVDEYSKLNINYASEPMLEGLFKALNFDDDDAKFYAGAIIDYRKPDDTYLFDTTQSKEEFYYPSEDSTLAKAHFKNANDSTGYVTPDELLQSPGMTPDILFTPREVYGDPETKIALINLVTVDGDGTININTAPLPSLTAVVIGLGEPDMDNALTIAEKIISHRNGADGEPGTDDDQPYINAGQISGDIGPLSPVLATRINSVMKTSSNLFEITSVGEVSRAKKKIKALVQRDWIVTTLTPEEQEDIENSSVSTKEGVKLQIKRWMEY